jgi:uncharacterized protein YkwD
MLLSGLLPTLIHRTLVAALAAVLLVTVAGVSAPAPVNASTETSMESSLQAWINRDRVDLGLQPLRLDVRLDTLAGERASWLAAHGVLSHESVDGTVCDALTTRAISWYLCGEDIGYTTYPLGSQAAASLYSMWKDSPSHWALLMSAQFNYVGIGVAYSSATATTYASIAFLEGVDRTAPWARMRTRSVSGTTVRFSWAGSDPLLQTHTAGLRDFNVWYRVDGGAWKQVRTATTATSITLHSRRHGHYYWVRVQARDRQGNLSSWSAATRVRVP